MQRRRTLKRLERVLLQSEAYIVAWLSVEEAETVA
jgi:hypothetical protein